MSLWRYLKPANGLPDPRGSLSTAISPDIIREMNVMKRERKLLIGEDLDQKVQGKCGKVGELYQRG